MIPNDVHDRAEAITLDQQLCFAIYNSANKVARLYRSLLDPFGLTFPQYLTLIVLWERAPCSVSELSHALDLASNTMTPLLKRLEALGYVTRSRNMVDERQVRVSLTAQGQAFRQQAVEIRAKLVCQLAISEQEIADLRGSLQNLSKLIDLQLSGA